MKITEKDIFRLEQLAKLELADEERSWVMADLNQLLQFIDKMNELDTAHVEPLVYIGNTYHTLRDDMVSGQVDSQQALQLAPDADDQFFKVPKVIDL
jgi:aspartyl-tRNA(Asn)/glutamyl-tRNA(Gln) amidotransferase subunit C